MLAISGSDLGHISPMIWTPSLRENKVCKDLVLYSILYSSSFGILDKYHFPKTCRVIQNQRNSLHPYSKLSLFTSFPVSRWCLTVANEAFSNQFNPCYQKNMFGPFTPIPQGIVNKILKLIQSSLIWKPDQKKTVWLITALTVHKHIRCIVLLNHKKRNKPDLQMLEQAFWQKRLKFKWIDEESKTRIVCLISV